MEQKMKNTIAFVTGGASGIGQAIVERIVKHDGKAVIADLNPDGQKVADALGKNVAFIKTDVTSNVEVQHALDETKKRFGGINVILNCAGIVTISWAYEFDVKKPHSLDVFRKVMDINATGTFIVATLAAGIMADNVPDENQQRGVIINVASIYARDAPASMCAYTVSKAAVKGMTMPLARCFGNQGIRVVSISPGYVDTPLLRYSEKTEHNQNKFEASVLTPKRLGKATEIAHMVQCIIENPFINGVDLEISGGFHFPYPGGLVSRDVF